MPESGHPARHVHRKRGRSDRVMPRASEASTRNELSAPADEVDPASEPRRTSPAALRWTVGLLALAAGVAIVPLWAPLLLAAWTAILASPLHARLSPRLGGPRAGALVTLCC